MSEWKISNSFNPFNTYKILKHIDYWRQIDDGYIPSPIAVTVDPANMCDLNCVGCNSSKMLNTGDVEHKLMDDDWIKELPAFLKGWGVRAVTLAGGGEPLLHPKIDEFIDNFEIQNLPLAMITNGTKIHNHLDAMHGLKWVGVSVDAGTEETYEKIRRPNNYGMWGRVIDNIDYLADWNDDLEVTFKFLINRDNINDIYQATKLAKELECRQIHLRPIGHAWYEERAPIFGMRDVEKAIDEVSRARADFEDDQFKVFGVTHKFDKNWRAKNAFKQCWTTFMYLVIEPGGKISTCCDNRGNELTTLADGLESPKDILNWWGSARHVEIFENIQVEKCPRCTFTIMNQAYENCVLKDTMYMDFI